MKLIIKIPKDAYDLLQGEGVDWLGAEHILDAVAKGKPVEECEDCVSRERVVEWLHNCTDDSIEHAIDSNLEFIPSVTLKLEESEDCVKRSSITEILNKMDRYVADELTLCNTERKFPQNEVFIVDDVYEEIVEQLPPVKFKQRIGEWQRMSDLPEDEDGRYQCSRCGNVVHFSSKENLYTFSRWCSRCGSNNDRR